MTTWPDALTFICLALVAGTVSLVYIFVRYGNRS